MNAKTGIDLSHISPVHRTALEWFHLRQGQEIGWPEPLGDGTFLVNRAKGIHKPEGWEHALSIRQTLNSPYADEDIVFLPDGSWVYRYAQEGKDPDYFTNKALRYCYQTKVPIGVLRQISAAPRSIYKVIGLALVTGFKSGIFTLTGLPSEIEVSKPSPTQSAVQIFNPESIEDARTHIYTSIVRRQGQGRFRNILIDAYAGKCAITGCDVTAALEAAHIIPYRGKETNSPQNGLLLRADLHTLFDLGLIAIHEANFQLITHPSLGNTVYDQYNGLIIRLPKEVSKYPSSHALAEHRAWSKL